MVFRHFKIALLAPAFVLALGLVAACVNVEPTPTPAPPTPTPTPRPTPTPTPTPIFDLAATVTAQNLLLEQIALNSESEEGGGFCSANSDGTGSLGIIGLLLSPMILYGIKKIRRIK